jgi:THAP4-like, heme-binding beta-barrel domain
MSRSLTVRFARALASAVILLTGLATSSARQAPPVDPFAPVAALVGRWEGTVEGQPGTGTVRREYSRVLNGRFIHVRNRSAYPAQEKNPKGEVHEDEGFISHDRSRTLLVFRQFHVEGFVNQYVSEPGATTARIVFTSEAIENIPAGWRARETYVVHGPDEFEEIFELAESGKPFEVYSRSRLRRLR